MPRIIAFTVQGLGAGKLDVVVSGRDANMAAPAEALPTGRPCEGARLRPATSRSR